MSRILVTGGAGFIGSHLVDSLIMHGHNVTVVDDLSVGKKKFVHAKSRFVKIHIQDPRVDKIFSTGKFSFVYHLAAQKNLQYSKSYPVEDAETNILGTLRVIESSKKHKVKKIIFYSTAAVYDANAKPPNKEADLPNPSTPYGIAKRISEKYLEVSSVPYTVLRLPNVYGPRQDSHGEGGVVAIFCGNLVKNKSSVINNTGRQTRDFIYVQDVVSASLAVMHKANGLTLNVSTQKETSVISLFSTLRKIAKSTAIAKKGKKIQEQYRSALANGLIKNTLAWKPQVSLEQGLSSTFDWFEKNI